jgi:hypothetical protein
VSGPSKTHSPALCVRFPMAPPVECRRPPRLGMLNKKVHADLPTVPESAHVHCQCLRVQVGAVRIVARACVSCGDRTIVLRSQTTPALE